MDRRTFTAAAATLVGGRSLIGADPVGVRAPLKAAPGPLDNPLKGWCPYTYWGEIHRPYSMAFHYVGWSRLEPNEGEYAFESWEKEAWDVPASQGKRVVLRVFIDYPKETDGMPVWLAAKGVKRTPYKDHGGGFSPDYKDPTFRKALVKFVGALGKWCNDHPRVAFVQAGLLGHWGEWHTFPRNELYCDPGLEADVVAAFRDAMPNV
ncbi:MAG: beta-galactosidase, partial [Planctomycetia bacterium]